METFDIGRVLSRMWSLVVGTLPSVGLFILIIQVVTAAVQYALQGMMMDQVLDAQSTGDPNAIWAIFTSGWYWAVLAFSLLIGALSFSGALHGLLQAADQRPVSVTDCFNAGVAKLAPVLGLTILWYLGVGLGWILLVVPGVILITMWSVALPVLVGENRGVIESFGRSRALTKGSRLMIFLTLLIFVVLLYVVLFLLIGAVIGGGMMGMGMGMGMGAGMDGRPEFWSMLAAIPMGWLFASALNALMVSIYLETLLVKEGGVSGNLTTTFE